MDNLIFEKTTFKCGRWKGIVPFQCSCVQVSSYLSNGAHSINLVSILSHSATIRKCLPNALDICETSSESRYHLENQHGVENAPFVNIVVVPLGNCLSESDSSFVWPHFIATNSSKNLHPESCMLERPRKKPDKNLRTVGPTVLEEHARDSHLSWKGVYPPSWLKTSWPWESQNEISTFH